MRESGLWAGEDTVIAGCHSEEELAEAVVKYLKAHKETGGIVGRNDMVACIAMYAAVGYGKRVPQDMGVVGFDNSSISRFCFPRLTTLEMQREAISRTVIDMMVQMIGGKQPENAKFETRLIVREST